MTLSGIHQVLSSADRFGDAYGHLGATYGYQSVWNQKKQRMSLALLDVNTLLQDIEIGRRASACNVFPLHFQHIIGRERGTEIVAYFPVRPLLYEDLMSAMLPSLPVGVAFCLV